MRTKTCSFWKGILLPSRIFPQIYANLEAEREAIQDILLQTG